MILYTAHISKGKMRPIVDTTVKSGEVWLAPSWDIVMGHKNGTLTDAQYTERYLAMMRLSYSVNRDKWLDLLRQDKVTLACYCPPGKFCHRLILVNILRKLCQHHNISFQYDGEV